MAGFWELPSPDHLPEARLTQKFGQIRHTITHHHYTFDVIAAAASPPNRAFRWFAPFNMSNIPLSTTARKALKLAKII